MKIIDFDKKGNQVKFYLGDNNCTDYWGDDWNDRPYEHNAGTVYDEYIKTTKVLTFDFDDLVIQPSDGTINSAYSKEDMKNRIIPCIIVISKDLFKPYEYYTEEFEFWNDSNNITEEEQKYITKYYFEDILE